MLPIAAGQQGSGDLPAGQLPRALGDDQPPNERILRDGGIEEMQVPATPGLRRLKASECMDVMQMQNR